MFCAGGRLITAKKKGITLNRKNSHLHLLSKHFLNDAMQSSLGSEQNLALGLSNSERKVVREDLTGMYETTNGTKKLKLGAPVIPSQYKSKKVFCDFKKRKTETEGIQLTR